MTVCIVSHDAGGAEILASYVAQNRLDCRLVLEGPAVQVFRRRLGPVELCSLTEAISACEWCLTGTGWQSDLEWRAMGEARRLGKRCVAFLDHWVNYPERFERIGIQHLPDEIWVGDEDAAALAREQFPCITVKLVANPYFADFKNEIAGHEAQRPPRGSVPISVLFVCENLAAHALLRHGDSRHWGYTEFDAIEFLFSKINDLGVPVGQVMLRPHPSDPPGKYSAVISRHAPLARLGGGKSLAEEIAASDIVAGCESTALVAAELAGKRVLCCVPPGQEVSYIGRRDGIEMLRDVTAVPAAQKHARTPS